MLRALEQQPGPIPAILRDCCRALRHKGFAYAEAWTRERFAAEQEQALQRAKSLPEEGSDGEPAERAENGLRPCTDTPVPTAEGDAAHPGRGEDGSGNADAAPKDDTAWLLDPVREKGAGTRRSALDYPESSEDIGSALSNMLSFKGHSAAVRSSFTAGGQQLEDLEQFRDSAEKSKYEQNFSIPGICWDTARTEIFDLRREKELDPSIREDPRTALATTLFDVVISVPVHHVTHKSTITAVLVFYRVRGSSNEAPGRRFALEDSLVSLLESAASICPLALNLHWSQASWQAAMRTCKTRLEASAQVAADSHTAHTQSVDAGAGKEQDQEAGAADVPAPLSVDERRRRWWKAYFDKWRGQGVLPQPGADLRFSAITGVSSFLTLMIIAWTDFYLRSNHTYDGNSSEEEVLFAIVGSFAAVIALVFAAPVGPVSQPRSIIWGHIICCVIAVVLDCFTDTYTDKHFVIWPILPHWFANALVPALGITAMSYTGTTHPPAAACATVYIADRTGVVKNLGWLFILFPVLFDCVIIIGMGVLCNNLAPSRQYPLGWNLIPHRPKA